MRIRFQVSPTSFAPADIQVGVVLQYGGGDGDDVVMMLLMMMMMMMMMMM